MVDLCGLGLSTLHHLLFCRFNGKKWHWTMGCLLVFQHFQWNPDLERTFWWFYSLWDKHDQTWAVWNWICWHYIILYAVPSGVGCFAIAIWAVGQTKRFDVYSGATWHFSPDLWLNGWVIRNWPTSTLSNSNLAFWKIIHHIHVQIGLLLNMSKPFDTPHV